MLKPLKTIMRKKIILVIMVFSTFLEAEMLSSKSDIFSDPLNDKSDMKTTTAVVIAGAASLIPQEAALLEQLYNTGWLQNITFISGVSSGALNTLMLNAILDGRITWERYKNILFSITNSQIFSLPKKEIPLDTSPLNQLLIKIAHDTLGYYTVRDLPITSSFSTIAVKKNLLGFHTQRFCNKPINDESQSDHDLVSVLMASTAIPIIFPPVKIKDFPDITYIDGGAAEDCVPYEALLQHISYTGKLPDKLLIVNKKITSSKISVQNELRALGIKDSKAIEGFGMFIHQHMKKMFISRLEELRKVHPELAKRTYVYTPEFEKDFSMLDFSNMKEQYEVSSEWARINKPVLLSDYLQTHDNNSGKIR